MGAGARDEEAAAGDQQQQGGAGAEYAQDGSVDLRGNPVLRSQRGGWKACSFIVGTCAFVAAGVFLSFGVELRLTTAGGRPARARLRWPLRAVCSVRAVRADGVLRDRVQPLHLPDGEAPPGHRGGLQQRHQLVRHRLPHPAPRGLRRRRLPRALLDLRPRLGHLLPGHGVAGAGRLRAGAEAGGVCPRASALQLGVYFGGLYTIALGNGGTKPNISTIGADQFDEFDPRERTHKLSFFNWWMFTIFLGILFSSTVLVYLQDNVSWSVGYGIPTLGLMLSICVFLAGTRLYRHRLPQGSPFTSMGRVLAAALWKWSAPVPGDAKELHELDLDEYTRRRRFRMDSTNAMRFLNKAAVVPVVVPVNDDSGDKDIIRSNGGGSAARAPTTTTSWSLCTVTQVEETKQILKLMPLLAAMFVPCTLIAQTNTLFVKQGTTMDRHMGRHFEIPPASLGAFVTLTMLVAVVVYDQVFVKAARRYTRNPRGITILKRMGTGMLLQVVTMAVASVTESHRLAYARRHGLALHDATGKGGGQQLGLTIFVLLPQFVLMGLADAFLVVGKLEFFYDQAPEGMKSLGTAMSLTAYGVGNFLSSFLLSTVTRVTGQRGNAWVTNDLNASNLDYYYAFLTVLGGVNFVAFLALSGRYRYRAQSTDTIDIVAIGLETEKAKLQAEPLG